MLCYARLLLHLCSLLLDLLELEDETSAQDAQDALIKTYDEHEDSVYSVAWSACDPWIFASLSYDGRVAVRNVPSEDKYRILL